MDIYTKYFKKFFNKTVKIGLARYGMRFQTLAIIEFDKEKVIDILKKVVEMRDDWKHPEEFNKNEELFSQGEIIWHHSCGDWLKWECGNNRCILQIRKAK